MKRGIIAAVLLIPAMIAGCSGNPIALSVGLGEAFALHPGETASITGEDMLITFEEVIGDSRCPRDAVCIWEGVAISLLRVNYRGAVHPLVIHQPGLNGGVHQEFLEYSITADLKPYPVQGQDTSQEDFRIELVISR